MRALTIKNMIGGFQKTQPIETTRPRKLPENLTNYELTRKLCFGNAESCKRCEVLDICRFGQQALSRKL